MSFKTALANRPRMTEAMWWRWVLVPLAFYLGAVAAPASWWIEVRSVTAIEAETADRITLEIDREIHRDFVGSYHVTIRTWPRHQFVCDTEGRINYRANAELPDPVYLWWWLGHPSDLDACRQAGLGVGAYTVETCHTVERPFFGLVPPKDECRTSKPFRIGDD